VRRPLKGLKFGLPLGQFLGLVLNPLLDGALLHAALLLDKFKSGVKLGGLLNGRCLFAFEFFHSPTGFTARIWL